MNQKRAKIYFAACFTFLLAAVASIFPLPAHLWWLRPHWLTLVLIYWVMFSPNQFGVITGFTVGLLLDLLHGAALGSTGLVLAFIAFLTMIFRPRLKQFQFWQQLIMVILLIGLEQILHLWVQKALGGSPVSIGYWSATLVSVMAWPILYLLLQSFQRKLKLS